jgi:DNA modification methylase
MKQYVANLVEIFREVRRVLKKDGIFWLNIGDSYAANRTYQVDGTKQVKGSQPSYGSKVPEGMKQKDLMGIPWSTAFALRDDGWYLRAAIPWIKANPMPASVKDRPTVSHEYIFLLSKRSRYYYDYNTVKMPVLESSLQRNQYAWNSKQRTHDPRESRGEDNRDAGALFKEDGRNRRTADWFNASVEDLIAYHEAYAVWLRRCYEDGGLVTDQTGDPLAMVINPQPFNKAHFAVFPERMIEPLIKAGCPEGGIVLDPFLGSGTVGVVAQKLGRDWLGCDISLEYCKIAKDRLMEKGETSLGMFLDL